MPKLNKKINILVVLLMLVTIVTGCNKNGYDGPKECQYVCQTCGKCMNANCDQEGHEDKCLGHEGTRTYADCEDICPTCGKCMNALCTNVGHTSKCQGHDVPLEKHLLLDSTNNYGGNFNKSLYGEGAPLNGELDVEDDVYYSVNDFYNSMCTESRTIIPKFAPYQQTMANSDGIACALAILNHDNVVDKSYLDEYKMVKKFENITNKTVYKNGTNAADLVTLFESYGYTAKDASGDVPTAQADGIAYFEEKLKDNKYIMIRWQYGIYYQWFIVLGVDTMGTESTNSDAVILVNPFDASDHYQDGYTVVGLRRFFNWFLQRDKSGTILKRRETVLVDAKTPFNLMIGSFDNIKTYPEVPELHLMFNSDGTYGGNLLKEEYGSGNTLNMGDIINSTDYNYFNFTDYYNMEDEGSRYICSGYQAFIQSMASSCNCCSILSIVNYYNYDFSNIHNNQYILARNKAIKGSARQYSNGTQVFPRVYEEDNELKQEALVTIYCARRSYFDDLTKSFNNYGGVGASSLHYVPSGLGYEKQVDTKLAANSTWTGSGWGSYTQDDYKSKGDKCMMFPTYQAFAKFTKTHLSNHEPISTGWNPIGGHWTAIFGFDDMGNDNIYDDVVMIADSSDCSDQYVDGYTCYPAQQFYAQWFNSSGTTNQMFVVFKNKQA